MVYFSKIGSCVINVQSIAYIQEHYMHDDVSKGINYVKVYFVADLEGVRLTPNQYQQLMGDIDHAATLMRIQKESKE